jgi:hypothetical protein
VDTALAFVRFLDFADRPGDNGRIQFLAEFQRFQGYAGDTESQLAHISTDLIPCLPNSHQHFITRIMFHYQSQTARRAAARTIRVASCPT